MNKWAASSAFGTYRLCEQRRFRAVSPEPPLLTHTSSESRGTFRQKARSLVPLNGWTCAVSICHDGMLEDTNSLDGAQIILYLVFITCEIVTIMNSSIGTDRPRQIMQAQNRLLEPVYDKTQQNDLCAQGRLRSAWVSAQSDRSLRCMLIG